MNIGSPVLALPCRYLFYFTGYRIPYFRLFPGRTEGNIEVALFFFLVRYKIDIDSFTRAMCPGDLLLALQIHVFLYPKPVEIRFIIRKKVLVRGRPDFICQLLHLFCRIAFIMKGRDSRWFFSQ